MHKPFKFIFDPVILGWAGILPFLFSTILVLTNSELEDRERIMGVVI